jgi:oligopeptide transport system substrate-binding protein
VKRLALVAAAVLLTGCGGSSAPPPPHGGAVLRLTIPAYPATLDPAKVVDLSSLNVAHELYAGLTRFSGSGVVPDLAESWDTSDGGLVWTFHLRKGIHWSDGRPITAEDFRRAWIRALAPATRSAYARVEMGNIRGARRFQARGRGKVGVEAPDDRTLRVTLEHPVPWLDEQVAWPVFFPVPRGREWSGPFRLASRSEGRLVLERNPGYWNASAVKPRRIVLTTSFRPFKRIDGYLPDGSTAPGFPWLQDGMNPVIARRGLPRLAVELLWLVTRGTPLADPAARRLVASAVDQQELVNRYVSLRNGGAEKPLTTVVPPGMPGAAEIGSGRRPTNVPAKPLRLTLAYAVEDFYGEATVFGLRQQLARADVQVELKPFTTISQLVSAAGPPTQPGIDMVVLGWSPEFFDAYNILDLFPCGSAFNIARWCDPSYDRLMHRAVRTLDDGARYQIERTIVGKLEDAVPAVALFSASDNLYLKPGVSGFRWSPLGFYELEGMTRS